MAIAEFDVVCPSCEALLLVDEHNAGRDVLCPGCGARLALPAERPAGQDAGRLPEAVRQRVLLPGRRLVEDQVMGEMPAAGRPKRQGGQLPAAREEVPLPSPEFSGRLQPVLPRIEPIPARGDVEMKAPVRKSAPGRRSAAPTLQQMAAAAEFGDVLTTGPAHAPPKRLPHSGPDRVPWFSPKEELLEPAGDAPQWGGAGPAENSPVFRRTLSVAVAVLFFGAIGMIVFLLRAHFAPPEVGVGRTAGDGPEEIIRVARPVLERVFASRTVEDLAREVRHPGVSLPRMQAWYARTGGLREQTVAFTSEWERKDDYAGSGVDFLFTTVRLDDLEDRAVALEIPRDGGPLRVDWEHLVSWSEVAWSEFLRTTSETPAVFRVTMVPAQYENGIYNDPARYLCFRVTDPGNYGSCYAYCEAGSPTGRELIAAVEQAARGDGPEVADPSGGDGIPHVMLRLRYLPEGKKFNQAAIEALVWPSWLYPAAEAL